MDWGYWELLSEGIFLHFERAGTAAIDMSFAVHNPPEGKGTISSVVQIETYLLAFWSARNVDTVCTGQELQT